MNEPKIKTLKNTMVLPDMINEAVNAALEKKGQDIVVLNLPHRVHSPITL